MFSRRHPYLFFILVSSSIFAAVIIGISTLIFLGTRESDFNMGEKVGVVEISGIITDARDTIRNIKKYREDDSIKAIVLRIDSPGGVVGPAQEIYREVRKTVGEKKIIASMGAVAASGGYYVAAGTDGIMANPGTITGSIGVIIGYTNFEEILQKIGLYPVVVKSGEYKDMGSPVRKMTEREKKLLQDFVDSTHRQFVAAVAEGRKMDPAKVRAVADGRIITGEDAKSLGLVDRLGNIEDAIEWAGRMGGIKGKISAVYSRKANISFIDYFIESSIMKIVNRIVNPELYVGYILKAPI
ncbi:MAG: signal peptide peptidase SppA [Proteobacteria bacterium]|nr:signal peptide peptidase SppA [Pseudomonadota bacterium]MBU1399251.1 signal peptide peptidase SppA [Pseudomonadota bacterium]MBU1570536.1 signal peptide peptidase SppA [Pseudomonadota bacterium]